MESYAWCLVLSLLPHGVMQSHETGLKSKEKRVIVTVHRMKAIDSSSYLGLYM